MFRITLVSGVFSCILKLSSLNGKALSYCVRPIQISSRGKIEQTLLDSSEIPLEVHPNISNTVVILCPKA